MRARAVRCPDCGHFTHVEKCEKPGFYICRDCDLLWDEETGIYMPLPRKSE